MNKKEQYVAAIDIGTTKIVAIVGKKNENGKIEILGLSKALSKGVKRGVVLNIEETVNAIQTTVEDVQRRSGILFSEVFVGIAGQHIKSMKNRGYIMREAYDDEIKKEEVFKLIEDMHKIHIDIGEEIIHVIPQNFIVDNETGVKSPIGMCGRRLEADVRQTSGGKLPYCDRTGRCCEKHRKMYQESKSDRERHDPGTTGIFRCRAYG